MSDVKAAHVMPFKLEPWDPLAPDSDEPDLLIAAQKREIRNILKSYTGYYDLFSELLQNALDAVEKRAKEGASGYKPAVNIKIDLRTESISVTDNGIAMTQLQFKQFLKPNRSFKDGITSRGNKGVGATYLAYGFNYLEVGTKQSQQSWSGVLKNGRTWIRMDPPFEKFIRGHQNPLGVDKDKFAGVDSAMVSPVSVLEYKYSLDALIEELGTGQKNAEEIGLVVCWEMGDKWRGQFDALSFLDSDHVHLREFHGFTHHLSHSASGLPAFPVIALRDLVSFLTDSEGEIEEQKKLYGSDANF